MYSSEGQNLFLKGYARPVLMDAMEVDGTLDFKIPKRPIRKKICGLPAFTTVRGGAYFFLPGIKALRYLATLTDARQA